MGYTPTPKQEPIVRCRKRFILVSGGEQAGKSLSASKFFLTHYFDDLNIAQEREYPEPLVYWLVAADYERTGKEFEYIAEDFQKLGILLHATKRVDPGIIEIGGGSSEKPVRAIIRTKSAKDPRRLAYESPMGIIGCEASQLDLETYWKIQARAAPRRAWVFLSGSFEGSLGWYPALYKAWLHGSAQEQSFKLPSYSNTVLYPGGQNDPEILRLKQVSSDSFFMERIEGEPCPPRGLVFPEFRPDIHVREVEWSIGHPVYLCVDPGYAGAYGVEVVQEINGQVIAFDEIYEQGLITEQIVGICAQKPWWKDVRGGAIDIAGTQHQAMAAPAEIWLSEGGIHLASQKVGINDGIERFKSFLKPNALNGTPSMVFSPRCKGILSELGACPNPFDGQTKVYKWKTDNNGEVVGDTPEDKHNHGIKALTYWLVDRYGYARDTRRQIVKVLYHRK